MWWQVVLWQMLDWLPQKLFTFSPVEARKLKPLFPSTLAEGQPCGPDLVLEVWAKAHWWGEEGFWTRLCSPVEADGLNAMPPSLPFPLLPVRNTGTRTGGVKATFPLWGNEHQEKDNQRNPRNTNPEQIILQTYQEGPNTSTHLSSQ